MSSGVQDLEAASELDQLSAFRGLAVVHFWAPWSQPCQQMNEAMSELAEEHANVRFLKVEAEEFPEVSLKYEVAAVPTFIFLKGGQVVDTLNGAHVPELAKKTAAHSELLAPPPAPQPEQESPEALQERLRKLTRSAPCILFMKGTPQEPRCGFSRQVVGVLTEISADFSTFNILADDKVRQGLKTFSNWPTYPQLYVNGELVGGLDILKELKESGELEKMLPKVQSLDNRLRSLTKQSHVMVFMKGSPEAPKCGFSRSMCQLLKDNNIKFSSFDILQDDEVRQGLKTLSNWPTYPQLYVSGELVGGLDILKELKESGELASALQ